MMTRRRAALAALSITAVLLAQKLPEDAEPDCRRGPGILRQCESACKAAMRREFLRGVDAQRLSWDFQRCWARCEGIKLALEECHARP